MIQNCDFNSLYEPCEIHLGYGFPDNQQGCICVYTIPIPPCQELVSIPYKHFRAALVQMNPPWATDLWECHSANHEQQNQADNANLEFVLDTEMK